MKKKAVFLILAAVAAITLCLWLFMRPETLGTMDHTYSRPETSVSSVAFSGAAGDRIRFSFSSAVEQGAVEITVYDSAGNVVEEWDRAERMVTHVTLERSDTYTVQAECKEFIGHFQLAVEKSKFAG